MKSAPPHPEEQRRLEVLRRAELLDTPAELDFDDIVALAALTTSRPMALISLVDHDRQWFKARTGLDAEQTPRSVAFCAHAILDRQVFEVPDAERDHRFADNPLVTGGPQIRAYAGVPLLDRPTGLPLGTLCVLDTEPRTLAPAERDALERLGHQVERLISARSAARRAERSTHVEPPPGLPRGPIQRAGHLTLSGSTGAAEACATARQLLDLPGGPLSSADVWAALAPGCRDRTVQALAALSRQPGQSLQLGVDVGSAPTSRPVTLHVHHDTDGRLRATVADASTVHRRLHTLAQESDRAHRFARERTTLLGRSARELQTPARLLIQQVRAFRGRLRAGSARDRAGELHATAQLLDRSLERLLGELDLDLDELQPSRSPHDPLIVVEDILEHAWIEAQAAAGATELHGVCVHPEGPLPAEVQVDRALLERALLPVVAQLFSAGRTGLVVVELRHAHDELILRVHDGGPPSTEPPRALDLHSLEPKPGLDIRRGIELHSSTTVVESLGGTLTAEGRRGAWTQVVARIPAVATRTSVPRRPLDGRILVLWDTLPARAAAHRASLEHAGATVLAGHTSADDQVDLLTPLLMVPSTTDDVDRLHALYDRTHTERPCFAVGASPLQGASLDTLGMPLRPARLARALAAAQADEAGPPTSQAAPSPSRQLRCRPSG